MTPVCKNSAVSLTPLKTAANSPRYSIFKSPMTPLSQNLAVPLTPLNHEYRMI
jgi:hypothetical protein